MVEINPSVALGLQSSQAPTNSLMNNPLQAMQSLATTQNAINQNKLFQQDFAAKQAMGPIAQEAIKGATDAQGNVDHSKMLDSMLSGAARDPRAAFKVPELAGQIIQRKLAESGITKNQVESSLKFNEALGTGMAGLLAPGSQFDTQSIHELIGNQGKMLPDPKDQAQWTKGALDQLRLLPKQPESTGDAGLDKVKMEMWRQQVRDAAAPLMAHNQQTVQNLNLAYRTFENVDTGDKIVPMVKNQRTGALEQPGLPAGVEGDALNGQTSIKKGVTPDTNLTSRLKETEVYGEHGEKGKKPAGMIPEVKEQIFGDKPVAPQPQVGGLAVGGATPPPPTKFTGVSPGQEETFKTNTQAVAKEGEKLYAQSADAEAAIQRMKETWQAAEKTATGPGAQVTGEIAKALSVVGVPPEVIWKYLQTNIPELQKMDKLQVSQAMNQLRADMAGGSGGRIGQMEFMRYLPATPGVDLTKEAIKALYDFTQKQYAINQEKVAMFNDFRQHEKTQHGEYGMSDFQQAWKNYAAKKGYNNYLAEEK